MAKIAVLGLGAMGSRMAHRLVEAGHEVTVWNRSSAAAAPFAGRAVVAASPRAAADDAEIVLSMVRDDIAARRVWLDPETGALAAMEKGTVAIDSSTVTPDWAGEFHAQAAALHIAALDAPVSGSLPQAEAGQLVFLVGGDAGTLARVDPVLAAMGSAAHLVGPAGSGARIKLAINALLAVQVAAAAELLPVLEEQGIAPARAAEVMGAVPVASPALRNYMAGMAAGSFPLVFAVNMIEKDLDYARLAAGAAPLPVVDAAHGVFGKAMAAGLGAENMNAVIKLYR